MSTSNSPLWKLQKEAKRAAHHLKRPGVLPPDLPRFKFGIVMDDKTIVIEMDRAVVVRSSEIALEAMIVREMQGKKADG